jgi:uncharacterized membrane protein
MGAGWFQAKFGLVILLSAVHGLLSSWVADFARLAYFGSLTFRSFCPSAAAV